MSSGYSTPEMKKTKDATIWNVFLNKSSLPFFLSTAFLKYFSGRIPFISSPGQRITLLADSKNLNPSKLERKDYHQIKQESHGKLACQGLFHVDIDEDVAVLPHAGYDAVLTG